VGLESITIDNLIPMLKKLGWEHPNQQSSHPNHSRPPQDHHVLLTVVGDDENNETQDDPPAQESQVMEAHNDMLREVYQVMQHRQ